MTAGQSDEPSDEKMGAYDLIKVSALEIGRSARRKPSSPRKRERFQPAESARPKEEERVKRSV
jgi:hypothetical protein